jgi:ubiquinone/menaquinone biosynthesis C-methylase UbiE
MMGHPPGFPTLHIVALHPLAAQFAGVAEAYERGRPGYPPAVVGAVAAELNVSPGGRVLDLAAGTGTLTRALVAGGYDVVAVEPLESLRATLTEVVGPERVREGVAEAIPLPDGSVEAITVADAFHWFDQPAALGEMRRVLVAGGGLALISTIPDWSSAPWGHELGTLISEKRSAHPYFDGAPWQETLASTQGWSAPWLVRVMTVQPASPQQLVDYVTSFSWVAAMPADQREEMLARVAELTATGTPAELPVTAQIWFSARD